MVLINQILGLGYNYGAKCVCWKCKKLVDKVNIDRDLLSAMSIISVECHGQKDSMTIDDRDLMAAEETLSGKVFNFFIKDISNSGFLDRNNTKNQKSESVIGKRKLL